MTNGNAPPSRPSLIKRLCFLSGDSLTPLASKSSSIVFDFNASVNSAFRPVVGLRSISSHPVHFMIQMFSTPSSASLRKTILSPSGEKCGSESCGTPKRIGWALATVVECELEMQKISPAMSKIISPVFGCTSSLSQVPSWTSYSKVRG